ncbi:hypothetical protein LEMLEM_LOCUS4831 [Lemmus lemmus]
MNDVALVTCIRTITKFTFAGGTICKDSKLEAPEDDVPRVAIPQ